MAKVLIADDEPLVRHLLRTYLEGKGHTVLEAGSAVDVFRTLEGERPDVVLIDVHLGADDGLAIGVGLRKERDFRGIRIAFMTGTMEEPELVRMSRLAKAEILAKPFDFAALDRVVGE